MGGKPANWDEEFRWAFWLDWKGRRDSGDSQDEQKIDRQADSTVSIACMYSLYVLYSTAESAPSASPHGVTVWCCVEGFPWRFVSWQHPPQTQHRSTAIIMDSSEGIISFFFSMN